MEEDAKEILLKLYRRDIFLEEACAIMGIHAMRLSKLYRANIDNILAERREIEQKEAEDQGIVVPVEDEEKGTDVEPDIETDSRGSGMQSPFYDISKKAGSMVEKAILEDEIPVVISGGFKWAFELATVLLGDAELVNISEGELDIDGPINIIDADKIDEVKSEYYAMMLEPKFEDNTVILDEGCISIIGK